MQFSPAYPYCRVQAWKISHLGPILHYSIELFPAVKMPKLTFHDQEFSLNQYETVLDCLLRNGQFIPYACRAGMCQACLIKAIDCEATEESKKWIKKDLQDKGYTLACQWVPQDDVVTALPSLEDFSVRGEIVSLTFLNQDTLKVVLSIPPEDKFSCLPGQYLTLINPDGIARSYSVANDVTENQVLEFHISKTSHGAFSGWLFNHAQTGDFLRLRDATGECYYNNNEGSDFPMILAGTGTGLAPIYGIVHDALKKGHQGPIKLFHGGRSTAQLYYIDELLKLADSADNFSYYPCIRDEEEKSSLAGICRGNLEDIVISKIAEENLTQTRFYLCGAPDFVYQMRKKAYLKGARSNQIFCDPYLEKKHVPREQD